MKYDFDKYIERRGTDSCKWNDFEKVFPGYDVSGAIPMWVADMDFPAPKEVVDAVTARAAEGIYGYPVLYSKMVGDATKSWLSRRHGWEIESKWVVAASGIVPAVTYAVQAFTEPGDKILIQPPVYYPFKDKCIKYNNRIAVENQLIVVEDGSRRRRYEIDFEDFEKKVSDPELKMFILCSPHNPVARVWTYEELARMVELCEKYDVLIFSDEIHSDLIMRGWKHVPTGAISEKNLIAAYAPSKTFNLAGIRTSALVIPDDELRKRYVHQMEIDEVTGLNVFAPIALKAAYDHGEDYLEQLIDYLDGNIKFAKEYLEANIPGAYVYTTEGTYFLWIDFNGTGLTPEEIYKTVLEKGKVAGDLGNWFGISGDGFIRLNPACPRSIVEEAVKRIASAFEK
ncbi:MAG: pyridoxal phosphate-dependent aminotransferase [Firmicutes bacterium]|nr:pyridoxal phosphate-dependent aminotransferase [Bacillota bacterium]